MDYIRRKKHRGISTRHINNQCVYNLVSNIPPGKVATYGQLASSVGNPRAARGIGKILNKNPRPIIVPCHRVVCSDGHIGGYMWKGTKDIVVTK
jgi:methylated-DNA-[protein]-cysteine S-methyltransferase